MYPRSEERVWYGKGLVPGGALWVELLETRSTSGVWLFDVPGIAAWERAVEEMCKSIGSLPSC